MFSNPHPRNLSLHLAVLVAFSLFTSSKADEEQDKPRRESPRVVERESTGENREDRDDRAREGIRAGERPREGAREVEAPRASTTRERTQVSDALPVTVYRDGIAIGDRKFNSMTEFRNALRGRVPSAVRITSDPDAPFQVVSSVIDALKSQGIREVTLVTRAIGSGTRDGQMARDDDAPREGGDRPREGEVRRESTRDRDRPREGEVRRESTRDGDRPHEGEVRRESTRDGDRPREGEVRRESTRDGDRPREGEVRREDTRDGESTRSGEALREGTPAIDHRQMAQLTRIYGAYDKDGSGGVTFEEWVAMKNYELTSEQKKREKGWFEQADGNKDGEVSLGEWIDWKASQGRR